MDDISLAGDRKEGLTELEQILTLVQNIDRKMDAIEQSVSKLASNGTSTRPMYIVIH